MFGGEIGFVKHPLAVWNLTLLCLMWMVWKEHNSHTFEDKERLLDQLESLLIRTLFDWSRTWDFKNCNHILEFQDSLCFYVYFFVISFSYSMFTNVNIK